MGVSFSTLGEFEFFLQTLTVQTLANEYHTAILEAVGGMDV